MAETRDNTQEKGSKEVRKAVPITRDVANTLPVVLNKTTELLFSYQQLCSSVTFTGMC
jgi:hypothetical protein